MFCMTTYRSSALSAPSQYNWQMSACASQIAVDVTSKTPSLYGFEEERRTLG